ncbi:thiosulfate sulfurtransferase [Leptospira biflexa]|uniref:sulfurtransferase n=1 Tax=Leptospira biflexa TaxID=172 RepID=UPI0010844EEA|nr:sulfurtransferase [Leptospira biflexa]TGM35870.1 thiosulfate sulfurtransferase [Leptospira biflexa]TGM37240.1 thiosulfate sulfurtransferase [Leptospira biflexa]TGM46780.1 thiosulfate sulfurtransferase [Leptospira biflexa]TGM50754.1 thiosulfate sulfurtransferase [Leptospira biflexa]TGM56027.1 thiosulfate sulfurtransferase [Leptospira biflexa]
MNWNFLKTEIEPGDFLIDCRSQSAYEEETLEGAYYYPFIKKAFGSDPESQKKLYGPMAAVVQEFQKSKKARIIVFDEGMGMFSTRMVYLLRGMGIKEAYVLGQKWPATGKKAKGELKIEPPIADKAKPIEGVVDKAFMERNLTKLQIFDARTMDEYEGRLPRLTAPEEGTLCGRLPGAFLWDWRNLYDGEANLIERSLFKKRLNGFPFMPERPTVIYDYNGARSCLLALMLREAGYIDVTTYQGSWFEWRKSNLPKQAVAVFGAKQGAAAAAPRVGGVDRKKV